MKKNHKIRKILAAALVLVLAVGAIGAGIFGSRVGANFQTNTFFSKTLKNRRFTTSRLLTQLIIPDPLEYAFDVCLYAPPEKPVYKGEAVAAQNEVDTEPGETFEVSLYVKNTGTAAWFSDSSGCAGTPKMRLGTAKERDRASVFYNPGDPRWTTQNRIAMVEHRVDPGEIATFRFESRAPDVTDIFREYFQPVAEGSSWLDQKEATAQVDIYVGETDETLERQLFYLGKSGQASSLDLEGAPQIEVDISEQKLRLKFGETVVREYTASTGTFNTPTPLGKFKILNKQELRIGAAKPHYRMPKWQGFTTRGHGLHALPYLASDNGVFWKEALTHIGQRVSHGCIRLLPEDAEDLYSLTEVGMPMVIRA